MANASRKPILLIVDDHRVLTDTLSRYFMRRGYEVLVAGESQNALTLIQDRHIDIALTDVNIPGSSFPLKEEKQLFYTSFRELLNSYGITFPNIIELEETNDTSRPVRERR